jgi:hypothetical protein
MHRLGVKTLAASALLAGCATGRGEWQSQERSFISAAEIAPLRHRSAYDVIKRLRPEYLKMRGPTTIMNPAEFEIGVYVDNMLLGGIRELRDLPAADVYEIRYLNAMNGATRHGAQHPSGVIEITTLH